jgi:hypothetical protein
MNKKVTQMRKILIFLFLTAPLAWAGPKAQKPPLNNPSATSKIETLNDPQNSGGFEYIGKESENSEENIFKTIRSPQVYQNTLSSLPQIHPTDTPLGEKEPEKEESPEEAWINAKNFYLRDTPWGEEEPQKKESSKEAWRKMKERYTDNTYSPWSYKEPEKKELVTREGHGLEWSTEAARRQEITKARSMVATWAEEGLLPEIMGEPYTTLNTKKLDEIVERKVEERFRTIQNQPSSFLNPSKKDQSIVDDAIYAAKTTRKEEEVIEKKEQEGTPPAGTRGVIKKVAVCAGLLALGFGASELKNQVFPKGTDNGELDPLINQMSNCTLNQTTASTETSWLEQEVVEPLSFATKQAATFLGNSWKKLLEKSKEVSWEEFWTKHKEAPSNVDALPETASLTQKIIPSKTETEL